MNRNEKNLSTKQPSSQTHSRVSHQNEHDRWPRSTQKTARQGPQALNRHSRTQTSTSLNPSDHSFPKSVRLLERREFLFLQQKGKKRHSPHFLVATVPARGQHSRFGITTSRRFGNAVVRNRMKRLLREFFRTHQMLISPACDIVVIPRSGADQLTLAEICDELGKAFPFVQPKK
ncbi:MAG: ribonuclease P protein component [Deltaproteobacteria bacterium]|nr:ribonuclease P protein component [Deltaproteobacteria bacterium]